LKKVKMMQSLLLMLWQHSYLNLMILKSLRISNLKNRRIMIPLRKIKNLSLQIKRRNKKMRKIIKKISKRLKFLPKL
jgi:hypothetical protein